MKGSATSDYVSVAIDSFICSSTAPVDLYLQVGGKLIKVIKRGDNYEIERLKNYQGHAISHFWVHSDDIAFMSSKSLELLNVASKSSITSEKKLAFMRNAAETVCRTLLHSKLQDEELNISKNFLIQSVDLLQGNAHLVSLLSMLNSMSEDFARHTCSVAIFSVLIAQRLGWKNKNTILTLAMGGLLHDIGFKEIDRALLTKDRGQMNKDELKVYESHPERGAQILSHCRDVSSEVVQIIMQHHESPSGHGFPNKLKGQTIYPAARLIHLSDKLADLTIKTAHEPNPKSLEDAVKYIMHTHQHEYSDVLLTALDRMAA